MVFLLDLLLSFLYIQPIPKQDLNFLPISGWSASLKLNSSTKLKIAIILVILCSLVSSLRMLWNEIRGYITSGNADVVTSHENRFKGVKEVLSPYGLVGYVTDQQSDEAMAEYYLTQYVLSPLILTFDTTSPSIVIGNFHKHPKSDEISKHPHLVLFRELDNGLILFTTEKTK